MMTTDDTEKKVERDLATEAGSAGTTVDAPAGMTADTPVDALADTTADAPVDADAPAGAPAGTPADADAPVDTTANTPAARSSRLRDLAVRSGSAAVYVVIMLVGLLLGNIATVILVCVLSGICVYEFYRIMRYDAKSPNDIIGLIATVCYPCAAYFGGRTLIVSITLILMAALLIWYVFTPRARITDLALTVFGALYCGLMLSGLVWIRTGVGGLGGGIIAVGVVVSVWANDSFAYLFGMRFGKHKLAPKISPKKSWEGFFAGIIGSLAAWCLIPLFVPTLSWPWAIVGGLICGIIAVFGDFVESRIKRGAGVKDAGHIMPGHGGMLDRCDSLIFVSFFAYVILNLAKVI